MNKHGINIILYPRSYNKRGDISLHSVQGVTPEGKEINVKLRMDEAPRDIERAPSIAEFSREDRKAKQACIATSDNGPDNREGVLLFSRAYSEGENKKGVESYVAKWATVLSSDSDSPEPIVGLGRMEIKKNSQFLDRVKKELNIAKNNNSTNDIARLEKLLLNSENYTYPAIMYYPHKLFSNSCEDINGFRESACLALTEYTAHGITGGLMVRLINKNNRLIKESYREIFTRYINVEQRYQTPEETVSFFIDKYINSYFSNSDLTIEAIPIARINNGPRGNKYYGMPHRYDLTKKMYYSDEQNPLLCQVAIRVTVFDDTDNTLLSRMNAISAPLGHPMRLDLNGRFSYLCDDEDIKLAQIKVTPTELIEAPIGLSTDALPDRALWLIMGENAPASREQDLKHTQLKDLGVKKYKDTETKNSLETENSLPTIHEENARQKEIDKSDALSLSTNIDNLESEINLSDQGNEDEIDTPNNAGVKLNSKIEQKDKLLFSESIIADDNAQIKQPLSPDLMSVIKESKEKELTGMAAFMQKRKN